MIMRKFLITAALLLAPALASAGPWCLVKDASENCRFQTAEECYTLSNRQGGYCKPNPREVGVAGRQAYCVITAGRRECNYRSKGRCLQRARQIQGGCVRNTEEDLRRAAAGQERLEACAAGDPDCDRGAGDFEGGGLESLGYDSGGAADGGF